LNRASLNAETLTEYLDAVDTPIADNENIVWPDNQAFFQILARTLHRVFATYDPVHPPIPAVRGLATD